MQFMHKTTLCSSSPLSSILDLLVGDLQVLRVCSQSLLSFTHVAVGSEGEHEDLVVEIDAPRLEYLRLSDHRVANFILKNPICLVEACINTVFNLIFENKFDPNDLPKRTMIRNFLRVISSVKDMTISLDTLEVFYNYSRCETLPLFRDLSSLRVEFFDYRWEMLPIFLESCPNLKSLVMGSTSTWDPKKEGSSIIYGSSMESDKLMTIDLEHKLGCFKCYKQ